MADTQAFLRNLWDARVSAILRHDDEATARRAMEAAVAGGIRVLEFTLTTPGALEAIADFARRPGLVVGAGTVLTAAQADAAVRAGASFLVSPIIDEAVVKRAVELGVVAMPGVHTPTEMIRAYRAGAALQKLFPAPAGGPAYVRSCRGPMPFLRIVPTNGVDEHDVGAWLDAGAFACGFVNTLFAPADLATGAWESIESRARRIVAAAGATARGELPRVPDPWGER
jgi:Entner-Doudoroff aldolase